ncbi:hypothetical protein FYL25_07115 [Lactobacillus salivarius]|uniref:Uncharacterized protein n=1 Tax=Ligilactobacillus salivarius TaxID=1624 RepID=A0A6N9IS95_9LACO|nr:hypothetical protein [Ligilactobacillus salivarius]
MTSRLAIRLLITTMTKYTDTFIFSNFHLGSTNWEHEKKLCREKQGDSYLKLRHLPSGIRNMPSLVN